MVEKRLSDGTRIAQLLASELDGLGGDLTRVSVTDADPDVEPTDDGAFAYAVRVDDQRLAAVYVHPDRAHIEFEIAPDVAAEQAEDEELRVRPKAVRPPKTIVFVEDGAEVKRAVSIVRAVLDTIGE